MGQFRGESGSDLTVICEGSESCKGGAQFNFGDGDGVLICYGAPDSCNGANINLLTGAQTMAGASFQCHGDYCSNILSVPAAFSNLPAPTFPPPPTKRPTFPPPPTPRPPITVATNVPVTDWCCKTSIPGFVSWRGRCWQHTTMAQCEGEPNQRCLWDVANCFQSAHQCIMRSEPCTVDTECCSEVCSGLNGQKACR